MSIECTKDLDAKLTAAGWTETDGIALWTNPRFPNILIDTNAEIASVYPLDNSRSKSMYDEDGMRTYDDLEFRAEYLESVEPVEPRADCGTTISALGEGRCYQCSCEAHACGAIDMDHDDWRGAMDRPRPCDSETYDPSEFENLRETPEEAAALEEALKVERARLALAGDDIPF